MLSSALVLCIGMQAEPAQDEAPGHVANALASELDSKTKKAPTGARARSIKTPLQREALEAAYLSKSCSQPALLLQQTRAAHALGNCYSMTALCSAVNQFPAEEVRRALGDRIQLTENQVQVQSFSSACTSSKLAYT